jgi:hypothetical protein
MVEAIVVSETSDVTKPFSLSLLPNWVLEKKITSYKWIFKTI